MSPKAFQLEWTQRAERFDDMLATNKKAHPAIQDELWQDVLSSTLSEYDPMTKGAPDLEKWHIIQSRLL